MQQSVIARSPVDGFSVRGARRSFRFWNWTVSAAELALLVVAVLFDGAMRLSVTGEMRGDLLTGITCVPLMIAAFLHVRTGRKARDRQIAGFRIVTGVLCGFLALAAMASSARGGGWSGAIWVAAGAIESEVLYRFALPLAVGLFLCGRGVHRRDAVIAGLFAGAAAEITFTATAERIHDIGGHVALMALLGYTVWRGRSLVVPCFANVVYVLMAGHPDVGGSVVSDTALMAATLLIVAAVAVTPAERVIDVRNSPAGSARAAEATPAVVVDIHLGPAEKGSAEPGAGVPAGPAKRPIRN